MVYTEDILNIGLSVSRGFPPPLAVSLLRRMNFLISPSTSWEGKAIVGKEFCAKLKVGLKLNIQKTKIMASGPITSWQIDGETVADFIFLGSKITADGDCSHEIKIRLLLGRKVMTNLDSVFKAETLLCPQRSV